MEGDEKIGLALARASELRFKISDAIECSGCRGAETERCSDEEEEESLLGIRDALESLEKQIASLQVLHQQQRYEREATLAQIDCSRKLLLTKLKQYKGEELEVIHEAATFASETVDSDDGFFLPPYPSHLHEFFGLNDLYSSQYRPENMPSKNVLTVDSTIENQKHLDGPQIKIGQSANKHKPQRIKSILALIAKSAISFIGIISALSLAGFKTEIRKKDAHTLNLLELFRKPTREKTEEPLQCSPGKTLIMEDGKPRCIVKERIEIPFGSDFCSPSINIGFG